MVLTVCEPDVSMRADIKHWPVWLPLNSPLFKVCSQRLCLLNSESNMITSVTLPLLLTKKVDVNLQNREETYFNHEFSCSLPFLYERVFVLRCTDGANQCRGWLVGHPDMTLNDAASLVQTRAISLLQTSLAQLGTFHHLQTNTHFLINIKRKEIKRLGTTDFIVVQVLRT